MIPSPPLSPVTTAVTPLSASHRNRRFISERMTTSSLKTENSTSMVSSTTRRAPMASISAPSRTNRPSRSYSPVSSISLRSMRMWSKASVPCCSRLRRSKPCELKLRSRSCADSSKLTNNPGSPYISAPFTRKFMATTVLPLPADPANRETRPLGSPPLVISSKPRMPVGAFRRLAWHTATSLVSLTGSSHHTTPSCMHAVTRAVDASGTRCGDENRQAVPVCRCEQASAPTLLHGTTTSIGFEVEAAL